MNNKLYTFFILLLSPLYLFALHISVDSAKDNFIPYSVVYIKDKQPFRCIEHKDDFGTTQYVACSFDKKSTTEIKNVYDDFFTISSSIKDTHFVITITPRYKLKLYAEIFDLTKDKTTFVAQPSKAKTWSIVGFKKDLPLLKEKQKSSGLNLPFYFDTEQLPYVGSLDIKGNPVFIKKVEDVKEYLRVKKLFANKKYTQALELIDDIVQKYPNTLFSAELLYYKIKIYQRLHDYDNVIEQAKVFLREYSSDENIPEVLSLIAHSYARLNQYIDADYFFDRLFSEFPNTLFTYKGYIYKGEALEESGSTKKAKNYYKKALYGTKDIDVAVDAADHLARLLLHTDPKQAAKYVDKIAVKKPSFFFDHYKESKQMMGEFADMAEYEPAAQIAHALLQSINPSYDDYEDILKNWALWLSKTGKKKEALVALNKYIKAFPEGDYIDTIVVQKDKLFFDVAADKNATARLKEYDKLIQEYPNDTIGDKALYEKAKLLLEQQQYNAVLGMKQELQALDPEVYTDVQTIITDSAKGAMQEALQKNKCQGALTIANEYNITIEVKWDDKIYQCALKGGEFDLARKTVMKHIHASSIAQRQKWLYRYVQLDFETGNYTEVIDVAHDLISLIDNPQKSPYKGVYRYLFDAYDRLDNYQGMIDTIVKIQKIFAQSYKDIDRYTAVVRRAIEKKDDTVVVTYAQKVVDIQNKIHSYPQSPYIDFTLYNAYLQKGKYTQAYKTIQTLTKSVQLKSKQKARAYYLLGNILEKLGKKEQAKKAYKESIKADKESAWAQLAQSALEI